MAYLTYPQSSQVQIDLSTRDRWVIGRVESADLPVRDQTVSRKHAQIYWEDGRLLILDYGSRNGTFVNNQKVAQPTRLKDGDILRIGQTHLTIRLDQDTDRITEFPSVNYNDTQINLRRAMTTVVFLDIVNYCGLTQQVDSEKLAFLISEWCFTGDSIAKRNGAFAVKTNGDSMMLVWIHESGDPSNELLRILEAITEIWEKTAALTKYHHLSTGFKFNCGVNTGQAMITNNGSRGDQDFTPIGDCVNVAARLEKATRTIGTGCDMLIGETTAKYLPDAIRSHFSRHQLTLKGFSDPHSLYGSSYENLIQLIHDH